MYNVPERIKIMPNCVSNVISTSSIASLNSANIGGGNVQLKLSHGTQYVHTFIHLTAKFSKHGTDDLWLMNSVSCKIKIATIMIVRSMWPQWSCTGKARRKYSKPLENDHMELKSRSEEDCVRCGLRTQTQKHVHWWTSNSVAVNIQPLLTKRHLISSLNSCRKWLFSPKLNYKSPTRNYNIKFLIHGKGSTARIQIIKKETVLMQLSNKYNFTGKGFQFFGAYNMIQFLFFF
jgi:hypothetical protein